MKPAIKPAILALLLAGCAMPVATTEPAKPAYSLPPDLQLVCYQGDWAVISELADQGAIFKQGCVQT